MITFLNDENIFPSLDSATPDGILAVGGDLKPERLINAYSHGIFPWYNEGEPIIWWSPDPRFVLFPSELVVSKSMKKVLNRNTFRITFDKAFPEVISACGGARWMKKQPVPGTWITQGMLEAYCELHRLGLAHSVEAWNGDFLAGGLYGVSLGRAFFGESMFVRESNASKAALIGLNSFLIQNGFHFIDSQVHTDHLASLGARHISRDEYIRLLEKAMLEPTLQGSWSNMAQGVP